MKRKATALTLVIALLFSFLFHGIFVQTVESQSFETVLIKADGSVEGTDKIQRNGNVYSFIDDISGSIIVEKDDIIVNGAGYVLSGTGERGLVLTERFNVTIRNMNIIGFSSGIYLNASSFIHILENNVLDSDTGIDLSGYWVVITRYDYHATNNVSILKNNITGNSLGIDLFFSHWNVISGNTFTNNQLGIEAMVSNHNLIVGNSFVENNGFAIHMSDSRNNTFYHNNLSTIKW